MTLYVASSFLFCLQRLAVFVNRVNLVVKNVVHQLASLYSAKPVSQCIDPTDVHLDTVFTHLGRALTILVTLDTVIDGNEVLAEHWTLYKRLAPFRAHSFFLFLFLLPSGRAVRIVCSAAAFADSTLLRTHRRA